MLTQGELNRLKRLVESYHVLFAVQVMGADILTEEDRELLEEFGIDIEGEDYWETAYKFGILSTKLKDAKRMSAKQAQKSISALALSTRQKVELQVVKERSFSHIKRLGSIAGGNIQDHLYSRGRYEKLLREDLGKVARGEQWYTQAISSIGHKTGDWERDLKRLVETEMHDVQQEGRARAFGNEGLVYKDVYPKACKYCIKLYTTKGIGTEPRIYKVADLRKNGDNYGKKAVDWKAVIGSTHPFCRCNLEQYDSKRVWDSKLRAYGALKTYKDWGVRVKS